ncbi:hypothetical protein, partial [Escherichia coli]
ADRNRSHWSTSKTPSYTKSVSWQHHQNMNTGISMRRNNLRRNPHEKNIIWEKIAIITASAFIIFAVLWH